MVEKILTHVKVPREPLATGEALYYDVTGEPSFAFVAAESDGG